MGRGLYPIRTVSSLTGVNAVTLRAWERRYGLLSPQRTAKGHRVYSDDDIARIRRIVDLQTQGVSLARISAALDQPEQPTRMAQAGLRPASLAIEDRWYRALDALNGQALEEACAMTLALYPVDVVCSTFMRPLLATLASKARTDARHAARHRVLRMFVRNKLCARLHQDSRFANGPSVVAATTTDSHDDVDLLFAAVALQNRGYRLIYLGGAADIATIRAALDLSGANTLLIDNGRTGPDSALIQQLSRPGLTVLGLGERQRNGNWADVMERTRHANLVIVDPDDIDRLSDIIGQHIPTANEHADHGGA